MSHRIEKVNELIRDHLAQIIPRQVSFKKGVLATVVKVDTTNDLSQSKVFLSIFPADQKAYVLTTIKKEIFVLQKELNQKLQIRILPKIIFLSDDRQEKLSQIEEIFEKIKMNS